MYKLFSVQRVHMRKVIFYEVLNKEVTLLQMYYQSRVMGAKRSTRGRTFQRSAE